MMMIGDDNSACFCWQLIFWATPLCRMPEFQSKQPFTHTLSTHRLVYFLTFACIHRSDSADLLTWGVKMPFLFHRDSVCNFQGFGTMLTSSQTQQCHAAFFLFVIPSRPQPQRKDSKSRSHTHTSTWMCLFRHSGWHKHKSCLRAAMMS